MFSKMEKREEGSEIRENWMEISEQVVWYKGKENRKENMMEKKLQ